VERFRILGKLGDTSIELAKGTTIGNRRILRFAPVSFDAITVVIEDARATVVLSGVEIYGP
jgi:hypothetical protein